MKKLIVLAFVVSALVACSKSKPAATTPPAGDAKMEGAGKDGEKKAEEPKAEGEGEGDKKPDDPCTAPK